TEQGAPILSADVLMLPPFRERDSQKRSGVVVRGVGAENAALRPEIEIVEGRTFRTGLNEVIVGRQAQQRFAGLSGGDTIKLRNTPFKVVGIFEANGTVRESEILTDVQSMFALRPTARYSSITVLLDSAAAVPNFVKAVNENPGIEAVAFSEPTYAAQRAKEATQLMELMAYLVGAIMAAAATFSAANAMLNLVHARRTEFATLRAIGFGSTAVVIAIGLEALVIAAVGAVVGTAIVSLILDDLPFTSRRVSTVLLIDRDLIVIGALWACGIGLIGALVPAFHAARMPIVSALRER
ncbi:MAG TPA: ABC transporter permease, partial [Steroidobacteraceae bacterium]|nr:ABC transporter permease [Steroidobacteraceae bacterium]